MDTLQESVEARPDSLALPKTIFIGSSSKAEDENLAAQIVKALHTSTVHPKCWTEEFPLGLLTFEALERMLRTCAGAVFIVTEDGNGLLNNNVMIELGLVAGRMGRKRVALCCTSNKIDLPSDLDALTRIENLLDPSTGKEAAKLSPQATKQLRRWAASLPVTPEGIPCTQVLHGYSGRWKVVLNFTTWRTKDIQRR